MRDVRVKQRWHRVIRSTSHPSSGLTCSSELFSWMSTLQRACVPHRCQLELHVHTQEETSLMMLFIFYSGGRALSVLLIRSPAACARQCRCCGRKSPLRLHHPKHGGAARCLSLSVQPVADDISRFTVTSEDRTSSCRTTKEKGAPQRCTPACSH